MIEIAIPVILEAATRLTDRVSTRIYPLVAPQKPTAPFVIYQTISAPHTHSHDGGSGFVEPRMQIDSYALTMREALRVAGEVRLALQGYSNTAVIAGTGSPGTVVQAIFLENERSDYDNKTKLWRRSQDYFIHHSEEIP